MKKILLKKYEGGIKMTLLPLNPFGDVHVPRRDTIDFFDYPSKMFDGMPSPRVDVYQTEKDVVVKAEMPGVSKEDLNLYIDESTVRLSGQTKRENEFKDENTFRSERYYGSFSRTISLIFSSSSTIIILNIIKLPLYHIFNYFKCLYYILFFT
jgi:HSP20 family protein